MPTTHQIVDPATGLTVEYINPWTYDPIANAWRCDDVRYTSGGDFNNLLQYGQPFDPNNNITGQFFIQEIAYNVPAAGPTVIFQQENVLTMGFGKNITFDDFDVVKNIKAGLHDDTLVEGQVYTLAELKTLGVSPEVIGANGQDYGDHALSTNLYGTGTPYPGTSTYPDEMAYIFGSVRFQISDDSTFQIVDGELVTSGRVELFSDDFNHESSSLSPWLSAFVAVIAGEAVNWERVEILYEGQGATRSDTYDIDVPDQCFPAGTPITLFDGTTKPIEAITQADTVLAYDADGKAVGGSVRALFTNTTAEFIRLSFSDGRDDLVVTPGHRFLTQTGDYMEIGHMLRLGGGAVRVLDLDGTVVDATGEALAYSAETAHLFEQSATKTIAFDGTAVRKHDVETGWTTYNFEVSTHHNYVAGGVRVHNDSILNAVQDGDALVSLNADLTNAAVLRDVDGNGTADFVTLDGFRDPASGVFSTQIEMVRVKYWDAANGDLATLLANVVANSPDALDTVFDPGNGNTWNDGTWGDDIEEAFFDDVLGATGSGPTGTPTGTPPYDEVIAYVDGVPVGIPDVSGASDPITLLASLSGLIAIVDGLKPATVNYAAGGGNVTAPAFEGISGVAAIAFLLGIDLGFELIPAVTVDGPFGPIEVSAAVTLGSLLDGQVGDQSQFSIAFGEGIAPEDVSQAQYGDDLILTIDNGDGTSGIMTLEGVYADGTADEVAGLTFADGTTLNLDQIPETATGNGTVEGTAGDDLIDAAFVDSDGDGVSAQGDVILAGLGNDTLAGGEGHDTLDGGAGTDTVLLDGAWDEFVFVADGALSVTDTNTVSGVNEGIDTLVSIEAVNFSDRNTAQIVEGETRTTVSVLDGDGGQLLSRTVMDTADDALWTSHTQTFAADGVARIDQVHVYDDGRILDTDYDANGVRTERTMTDVDDAHAWTSYTQTYAADGVARVDQVHVYDDGRTLDTDFDANGVRTERTMTDVDNAHAWTSYTQTFAADGVARVDQVHVYDDGRMLDTDYDVAGVRTERTMTDVDNAHAWTSYTQTFAVDGIARIDQIHTYDDGRTLDTDYDVNGVRTERTMTDVDDAHAWTSYTQTFAADGITKTDQIHTYDDGRILDTDYDANGVRTERTMTDVDDAYSWASYTQTFDLDGTLLSTVYVDDLGIV
ncbi:hypothetical protein L0664_02110 [Octadecabacter sp. G9-8]|uniref:Hint domain-containing protein n=1 Tax=Octadecabacter dasysiphoniae TaxID=2909341 RepID=A0ABS9CUH7_9RHOB|nr:hypothetical protein [Octadecabacter dasysiphoniae]MCF2869851.1 hypothetical protein [Octadecabacter dasysiphoniae]